MRSSVEQLHFRASPRCRSSRHTRHFFWFRIPFIAASARVRVAYVVSVSRRDSIRSTQAKTSFVGHQIVQRRGTSRRRFHRQSLDSSPSLEHTRFYQPHAFADIVAKPGQTRIASISAFHHCSRGFRVIVTTSARLSSSVIEHTRRYCVCVFIYHPFIVSTHVLDIVRAAAAERHRLHLAERSSSVHAELHVLESAASGTIGPCCCGRCIYVHTTHICR